MNDTDAINGRLAVPILRKFEREVEQKDAKGGKPPADKKQEGRLRSNFDV
jgi:hypothetical protein